MLGATVKTVIINKTAINKFSVLITDLEGKAVSRAGFTKFSEAYGWIGLITEMLDQSNESSGRKPMGVEDGKTDAATTAIQQKREGTTG